MQVVRALDEQQGRDLTGNPFFEDRLPPGDQEAQLRAVGPFLTDDVAHSDDGCLGSAFLEGEMW